MVQKKIKIGLASAAAVAIIVGVSVGITQQKRKETTTMNSNFGLAIESDYDYDYDCIDTLSSKGSKGGSSSVESSGWSAPEGRRRMKVPGTEDYQRIKIRGVDGGKKVKGKFCCCSNCLIEHLIIIYFLLHLTFLPSRVNTHRPTQAWD